MCITRDGVQCCKGRERANIASRSRLLSRPRGWEERQPQPHLQLGSLSLPALHLAKRAMSLHGTVGSNHKFCLNIIAICSHPEPHEAVVNGFWLIGMVGQERG